MDSLVWKRRIGKFYSSNIATGRKLILLYHAVGEGPLAMNAQQFSTQMHWLSQHCKVMSLSDLLKAPTQKEIQVALSFDDGYACLYQIVAPILAALNMPAIVYANTGWLSESEKFRKDSISALGHYPDEKFLLWDEVATLKVSGWEIGSHGVDHLDLTSTSSSEIKEQLFSSKQSIEHHLNAPCLHFAYTWGRHNIQLRQAVQTVGYQHAAAAHHMPLTTQSDDFALPRMNVENRYTLDDLIRIIQGNWDYIGTIHQMRVLVRHMQTV